MLLSSRPPPIPPAENRYCLFLDFDGTLVDFAESPGAVVCDSSLVALLADSWRLLDGALAIVSGRQIHAIDTLIAPLRAPVAGLHGFERRGANGITYRPTSDGARLDSLRDRLLAFVEQRPGMLLEDKTAALAVHFRNVPHLGSSTSDFMLGLKRDLGDDFELLEGDAVIEIKPATHNKATAVEAYMQEAPFAGRVPIYIGDDITDSDGFVAVERHQGMAIGVGNRVLTPWRLRDPAAVRAWLLDFNTHCVR